MIKAFPKIFHLGKDYIKDIFDGVVVVEEKVDGSQFCFGKLDGQLYMRSKGKLQYEGNVDKMFNNACDYILSIQDKIPNNHVFYCEYLNKPKHNSLKYDRVPKNYLVLFGVCDSTDKFIYDIKQYADLLDIDMVPRFFNGEVESIEQLKSFLETDSYLGGCKIEGFVVKNYNKPFLLGGQPIPIMSGKYVSEGFKEVHRKSWGKDHTSGGKWSQLKESYRTEARWDKAIQHLRDNGELENSPKDIGKLLKEINRDIEEEEKDTILKFLWKEYGTELLRRAGQGFPEYYKTKLMEKSI